MLHRRFALLLVVLAAAAAVVGACGDDGAPASAEPDAGSASGAVGEGICPTQAPVAGEGCVLPEGTTCAFSACGAQIARCSRGLWQYSGNEPPRPQCPDPEPPAPGSACPPCWPAEVTCAYGSVDCSASANRTVASCPSGRWLLEFFPCAEAGADVQRDAGPDAD